MTLREAFVPRDETLAKRLLVVLTVVAAVVTVAFALLVPAPEAGIGNEVALVGPALVLVATIAVSLTPVPPAWLWAAWPLGGTAVIALSDLATRDASVTAQIFFFFPVLYAGAQLRRTGATVVVATAVLAEITVTFTILPTRTAVADTIYVISALSAAAALLVYSGERVDQLIARLRAQAAIDPLTGLVTRRVLDSAATAALESAASNGGTALLLVDIDHFKTVNDVHGHPAGDLVLQKVSALLDSLGHRTDVVSRMGGDEFAILMPGGSISDAVDRGSQVLLGIRALRVDVAAITMARGSTEETSIELTVSIGMAHLPTHATDVHDLYRAADISLYRAKRGGRDQVAGIELHAA